MSNVMKTKNITNYQFEELFLSNSADQELRFSHQKNSSTGYFSDISKIACGKITEFEFVG
jgi:hypothetical protein